MRARICSRSASCSTTRRGGGGGGGGGGGAAANATRQLTLRSVITVDAPESITLQPVPGMRSRETEQLLLPEAERLPRRERAGEVAQKVAAGVAGVPVRR